jgi:multidrug efflux pump subunit AcrA (membrane-fusion protein)
MPIRKVCFYIICILFALAISCKTSSKNTVESYRVIKGEFIISVTQTGELEAVNSKMISTPLVSYQIVTSLKVKKLVVDGTQVKEGDVLAEFDKSEVEKALADAKAELEIAEAELRKTKANQKSKLEELTADLEVAKLNHRISQLNLQLKSFEADVERKKIELDLEKAAISLDKAEQEIKNQKRINNEEISILELKARQVRNKIKEAETTLALLTITAPASGIAILNRNPYTGEKYQIDDMVFSSWPMIGLPDLSLMKANIMINEVDIAKIDTFQESIIRPDAFPDTSFIGHVTEIATLARTKDRNSKVKVFDVSINLDENSEILIPGMTVSCKIIVEKINDVLYIPLVALFNKDGDNVVYVKKSGGFEIQNVKVGSENDNFVVVLEGLKEGDEVALAEPPGGKK